VTADPKFTKKDDNLVRQPTIASGLNTEESSGVVIVGGGSGAIHAIESLREVRSSLCVRMYLTTAVEWIQGPNHRFDQGEQCAY